MDEQKQEDQNDDVDIEILLSKLRPQKETKAKKRIPVIPILNNVKIMMTKGPMFGRGKTNTYRKMFSDRTDEGELGITLRQLRIIWEHVESKCKQLSWMDDDDVQISSDKVNFFHLEKYVIKPITQRDQSPLTDVLCNSLLERPKWYVTYDKNATFHEFMLCLEQHNKDFSMQHGDEEGLDISEDTPIWINSFSVNLWRDCELKSCANVLALKSTTKNNILIIDQGGKIFGNEEIRTIFEMEIEGSNGKDLKCSSCMYTAYEHLVDLEKHEHRFAVGVTSHGAISDKLDIQTFRREEKFPNTLMESFLNIEISNKDCIGKVLQHVFIRTPAVLPWILSDTVKLNEKSNVMDHLCKSIRILRIYDAPYGSKFIRVLADFIKRCDELEDITIENTITKGNLITNTDIKYLASILKEKGSTIKKLDLWRSDQSLMKILIEEGGCDVTLNTDENGYTRIDYLYKETMPDYSEITFLQRSFLESERPLSSLTRRTIHFTLKWALHLNKEDLDRYLGSPEGVFLKQILNSKFCRKNVLFLTLLNLVIQMAIVLFVSFDVEFKENIWNTGILSGCAIVVSLFEIIQIVNSIEIKEHLASFKNFIDLAQFGLIGWFLIDKHWDRPMQYWDSYLLICTIGVVWINLLFYASYLLYPLAIFMSALGQILIELIPFLFTTLLATSMFAHMFQVAHKFDCSNNDFIECPRSNSTEWFHTQWEGNTFLAYTYSLNMMLQSVIWFDEDEDDISGLEYVIMSSYAFTIGILLLNVIIAIVSNAFTNVQDNAERAVWTYRLTLIGEVDSTERFISSFFSYLTGCRCFMKSSSREKNKTRLLQQRALNARRRFDFTTDQIPQNVEASMRKLIDWWRTGNMKNAQIVYKRVWLFYKYAPLDQIIMPGKELRKILIGCNTNIFWKVLAWFIELILLCVNIMLSMIFFLLGLVTLGLFWPEPMRRAFFYINTNPNVDATSQLVNDQREEIDVKNETIAIQSRMIEEQNGNRKLEKNRLEDILRILNEQKKELNMKNEMISLQNESLRSQGILMNDQIIKVNYLVKMMEGQKVSLKDDCKSEALTLVSENISESLEKDTLVNTQQWDHIEFCSKL